ncbi:MAG: 3-hydroxyacyl-ACP dehydratase FabZ [Nitrospinaceae bacterium]|nr:3-hydroxyacyl-ACP dehydratase FabZ [Nitrospinaceae bacterium]MBT3434904.1 3-hydroxyacyl-ACP dehydratase FabZ [Nitrospinaceae bacterium]MBT3819869.1 3-hydroxyacyl-ACP dehydratase FabZ [Nitrospinaceae bacterium]MBT4095255.1 3-hydroxyacyl-ACP dehydratase FabZ [Nitrospinaceae bacterium]MBT4429474.1 3-hydroxyacyl-ACP dehydratase FabZ [Nitrospinaceae bacterium]
MISPEEILELLPHRYPMLLIDKVLELDTEAVSIVAIKNVTRNEPFFNGHFPDNPIMPGVMMIEAMAQAALLCIFGTKLADPSAEFRFAGIEQAKFRRAVVPGDQLRIEVKLLRHRSFLWKVDCVVKVEDETAVEAVLTAHVIEAPSES